MNLDDLDRLRSIDRENLLAEIDRLPDDLWKAWESGLRQPLPDWKDCDRVVLAGMGNAGTAADLLVEYARELSPVPLAAHHNYSLPAHAAHPGSLVIVLSDEETGEVAQSWLSDAAEHNCRTLLIAPEGGLKTQTAAGAVFWRIERANALAGCIGMLLAAFTRLGLIPDQADVLREAVAEMRAQQGALMAESPVVRNLAKRDAGQLMGRLLVFVAADGLAPVARHWKNQVNLFANAWAQVEILPDANHNTLEGILHPEDALARLMVLFLRAGSYHPRNRTRIDLTRHGFMVAGMNTDSFDAQGGTLLAQMLTALHFGDYLAYYLAIASGVDPSDRQISASFRRALSS